MVKVTALNAPDASQMKRTGFLTGYIQVPDDFDSMGNEEIANLFGVGK